MAGGMKPTGSNPSSIIDSASENELVVAQILLDLRRMFDIVESLPGPKWKRKRKRSCLSEDAPPSPAPSRERMPQVKEKEEERAATSASPDTPLNFPRSESYEKLGRSSRKNLRKKSTREYIALMEELTQRGDLLRKEINKVTDYRNKLKAQNSQLKAMKQGLLNSSCPMRREAKQIAEATAPHPHPQVSDRTAEECQYSLGLSAAQLSNGPGAVHRVGPFVIPDLNVSAEEGSEPLDGSRQLADRRARFAEARRRRRDIIRSKFTSPAATES